MLYPSDMSRRVAVLFLSLAVAQVTAPLLGQDATDLPSSPKAPSTSLRPAARPASSTAQVEADRTPVSTPQPQIVVNSPPAQAAPWTWHDRVLWGADIILVVLGYIGVMLALRTLKNIQKQTEFGVAAAQAALQCANAALESSQAIVDSGRPWIVISVEPFMTVENGFKIMATNRGRTPGKNYGESGLRKDRG